MKFETVVLKLGGKRTVIVITALSIILSVLLTLSITYYFDYSNLWSSSGLNQTDWILIIFLAVLVPLIVAPVVCWNLVKMVFKIHELQSELRKLATIDSLTGLLNQGAMMSHVEQMYKLAIRDERPIAFIMMDIDHFKRINDRYGHAAGDMVLQQVGFLLKNISRASDVVGRVGGEEFLACLYGASSSESANFVDRLQEAIRLKEYCFDNHSFKVTLSIGVARLSPLNPLPLDALLKCADQALYQAKHAGRDQFIEYIQEAWGHLPAPR